MSSQFRGPRPATGQLSAPARPVRRESYPDCGPQSRHNAAPGCRRVSNSRRDEWTDSGDEFRYLPTFDAEGGAS
jgi:hypothetical protein